ncbi:ATP-binding cassette domain-containing protein [Candidatus Njordibacter sp. Uisw_002]|uniref:ATP-binding cassette domain-containing protein n=1 Tax=Candidatus Njordibacter sp. Uisw_002 TaxID=3230971 RepID=UPI003D42BD1D
MSLELRSLCATLSDNSALFSPVNLVVEKGEVACVMGPSGVGKSTLLNAIGGHLDTHFGIAGDILLNGKSVKNLIASKRQIGVLFQDPLLFPHLSVGDNLAFGLCSSVVGAKKRKLEIEQALEQAQLSGFYHRNPATLSGGQQSRVALMRALLARPQALLLDEPFAKLDMELKYTMRDFLFDQARQRLIPILLVTHERKDVAAAKGPLIVLQPI